MESKARKRVWLDSEINIFLDVWEEHIHELRRAKRNSRVLCDMHLQLKTIGVVISIAEIKNKIKNMTQRYRVERKKAAESPSNWVFYEKLNKFLAAFPCRNDTSMTDSILDDSNPASVFSPEFFLEKVKNERVDREVVSPCSLYSNDTESNSKDSNRPESIKSLPPINPCAIIDRLLFNENPTRSKQEKTSDNIDEASADHVSSDSLDATRSKRELTDIHEDILAELVKFNSNESKRLKLQTGFNERSLELLAERNELERKRNDISERYLRHYRESNDILKKIIKKKKL